MAEKVLLDTGCVLRCQENDIHMDYDGGRVVLVADAPALGDELVEGPEKLGQVTVVLNYRRDDPMAKWPVLREERARRRFRLQITEIVPDEAPAPTE
nr:MAG: hypothetical protein DIU58_17185 [Sphaerobacter thermophilus]